MNQKKWGVVESELIARLSVITGYNKQIIRDVIKAQTEFVLDEIKNGIPVRIGGLGDITIGIKRCNAGFHFGDMHRLDGQKDSKYIKFKASATLKRAAKESD
jgi:nucleoid DNA-binding protein